MSVSNPEDAMIAIASRWVQEMVELRKERDALAAEVDRLQGLVTEYDAMAQDYSDRALQVHALGSEVEWLRKCAEATTQIGDIECRPYWSRAALALLDGYDDLTTELALEKAVSADRKVRVDASLEIITGLRSDIKHLSALKVIALKFKAAKDERDERSRAIRDLAAKARKTGESQAEALKCIDSHPRAWDITDLVNEICDAVSPQEHL